MSIDLKLYFSGSVDRSVSVFMLEQDVHRLFTYAYPEEVFDYLRWADGMGKRCRIMMDSGAFTAWNAGRPVVLEELMAYNKKVLAQFGERHDFVFISLDVIPGERGQVPTAEDIASAVDRSYQNFLVMQQEFKGHYVLPVYHSGEDPSLRNAYLQLTDYICLSMNQDWSERDRLQWAKRSAIPGFRYHGLAATGNRMATEVAWYSVDSSSWVTVGSMGNILWPGGDHTFKLLAVSKNSPARHDMGYHVNNLAPIERDRVLQAIADAGFDFERLCVDYRERWRWNVLQWCNPPWRRKLDAPMDLFS